MDKTAILERFDFYRNAPDSFKQTLTNAGNVVTLDEGSFYLREGDVCQHVAIIGEGRLRVFKVSDTGREITLYQVGAGESCLLNITGVMTRDPSPASAIVEKSVTALVFPADQFQSWFATNDQVREFVFGLMARRMTAVMQLVEEITFKRMDERVGQFLRERFASENNPEPVLTATHEQIAAELGTAREVVSRLLKEFERLGAIRLSRGRIFLQDPGALEAISRRQ